MQSPEDLLGGRKRISRRQAIAFAVVGAIFILVLSLRGIAVFYTDYLWFGSVHLTEVWRNTLVAKVGLSVFFMAVFLVACYLSLTIAERTLPEPEDEQATDELVRRYRANRGRYARLGRVGVSAFGALIVGLGTSSEWQNWILFRNYVSFGTKDPVFGTDVGFFVFKLPFLLFLVRWSFLALTAIFVITAADHYLNGNIRTQGRSPRVSPKVKAHMSLILALMALTKAAGYYLQRYQLDTSTRGYVEGAGYTDIHAQLPAIELLIVISLASCVLFVVNIRRQGWVLPVIGLGLWAFLSVVLGAIYPAIIQNFVVQPSQALKEQPYIGRNIAATRFAMGINNVQQQNFPVSDNLTQNQVLAQASTLNAIGLWGPNSPLPTFDKLQDIRSYFQFNALSVDRYNINGVKTPVLVGVRQLNAANLPAQSWVNLHLQFTHGYGAVISPANQITQDGNPSFALRDVPPVSFDGAPPITQPQVYFGQNLSGYVIANSAQPEIDFQSANGATVETHYNGVGGVKLSSALVRAAFAMRFGDINVLISSLITHQSRMMFVRDIQARVAKAAPFLTTDSSPYPVLLKGRVYWVQDAYTTTNEFPYSQQADTSALSQNSGLNYPFNYIRNSVKILIDAYNGTMTFYVQDPSDPIIKAYEKAFPGMFTPASKMSPELLDHLRYPTDLFTIQAAAYGRYHITNSTNFYNAGDAWTISQNPGNGSPSQPLTQTVATNAQGFPISAPTTSRMQPIYEIVQIPGYSTLDFSIVEAFVPVSQSDVQQNLTGMFIGLSDPGHYGQLVNLVTPRGQQVDGPALINARINAVTAIAQQISLLDQHGSQVILGSVHMIPLGQSLLYLRPLYVESAQNPLPELKQVIVVYGSQAAMEPTLAGALNDIFGVTVPGVQGANQSSSQPPPSVIVGSGSNSGGTSLQSIINQASALYSQAQAALKAGNLGLYQQDINQLGGLLTQVSPTPKSQTKTTTSTTAG